MWILVGMMGAGKTTIGRGLAGRSGREFRDTDSLLQKRFGRPVSEIFRVYGEETFRDHETSILKGLEPGPIVLATGGGIVLRDANWVEMRRLGTVVFLDVESDVLQDRLERSKKRRPLLSVDDWQSRFRAILNERRERYELADHCLTVADEDNEAIIDRLLRVLEGER